MARSISGKMRRSFLAVALLAALVPLLGGTIAIRAGLFGMLDSLGRYEADYLASRFQSAYQEQGSWDFLQQGLDVAELDAQTPDPAAYPDQFMFKRVIRPQDAELSGAWWLSLTSSVALTDAQGVFLAGNHSLPSLPEETRSIQLTDALGKVAGYLVYAPAYQLVDDNSSYLGLLRSLGLLIAGVVILAVLAVWLLARRFRRPIDELRAATTKLAAGKLETRLPERGRPDKRDEIEQIAVHFNQMAAALQAEELARRRWLQDSSHELRTPLTLAKGTVCAMRDGLLPCAPESLDCVDRALDDLDSLVGDLAELARADAAALSNESGPVVLADFLPRCISSVRARAAEAGHELELELNLRPQSAILADPLRLRQIISNILNNSLAYTEAPGRIVLRAFEQADQINLSVEDTRPCPDAASLPHLFERFFRGDPSRHGAGSGLGLSISKALTENMNGRITATASEMGGLKITLTFPRA